MISIQKLIGWSGCFSFSQFARNLRWFGPASAILIRPLEEVHP